MYKRQIEHFFHLSVQPVDLIYKKHIILLQVIEDRRHLPGLFNGRTAGHFHMYTQLISYDTCQCGLAQSRRAVEQHMVQRIISCLLYTSRCV